MIAHELTHVVQQGGLGTIGDQASLRRLLPPIPPRAGGNAPLLRRQPADEPDEPLDAALARQDTMDRIAEDARKLGEQLDAAGVDIAESDEQAAPFFVREAPEVQRIQRQIAAGRVEAPAQLAKLQRSLTLAEKAYLTEADDLDELRAKIALVETLNSFTPALLSDTAEYEALLRQQKTGESDLADNIAFIEGIRRQIEITRRFLPERAAYLAQKSRLAGDASDIRCAEGWRQDGHASEPRSAGLVAHDYRGEPNTKPVPDRAAGARRPTHGPTQSAECHDPSKPERLGG